MQNRLKYLLLGVAIALGAWDVWRRLVMLATPDLQPVGLTAFVGLFIFCVVSLIGFSMIQRTWLRWSLAATLAAGSLLVDGYQWAVGGFMDYEGFVTILQSRGDIGSAFAQQGAVLAMAAGKALILLFAVVIRPAGEAGRLLKTAKWAALPILLMLTSLLYMRGGEGASGLPSPSAGVSFALLNGYDRLISNDGPREKVAIKSRKPAQSDIVLIIDESIAGAYLDINSTTGVYSGLNQERDGVAVHNFGLATSITHCSVGSNITLRFGGTRDNYRDIVKSGPSIWAYAKKAGMGTVYIDAQRTGGAYQNGMTDAERAKIDEWHQFEDVKVLNRDHVVADRLAGYLNDDEPQFILVNKVGAHFPVSDKFPMSHAKYRPMLKRGKFVGVTDMATKDNLDGRQSNWVLYRNSYRNTASWTVGGFFDRLFGKSTLNNATIIYTSDHGQTFHERGENGLATHCTPNPEIEEGIVPLVVIGNSADQEAFERAALAKKDRLSHYRIFPTLLKLMGYAESDIKPAYGSDIFADEPDPFTFNIRFNARFGSEPVWKHVPIQKITQPPVSDYAVKTAGRTK